jgi:hypothetical protein
MGADFSIGLGGKIQYVYADDAVDKRSGLVIIDASQNHINLLLPEPHTCKYNTLAIVAKDITCGIDLIMPEGAVWLDDSNVELNNKGDALTLISDRETQWICIARYTANFGYY